MIRGGVESNGNLAVAGFGTVVRPRCSTVDASIVRGARINRGRIGWVDQVARSK